MSNSIQNINERFGILNASNIRIFDKSTKELLLKFAQGNSLALDIKSDTKTATEGGVDAITWNLPKTGTLKFSAETISFPQLAEALGSKGMTLNTEQSAYDRHETFTVTTAGTLILTLAHEPMASSVVNFHSLTRDNELKLKLTGVVDGTDKKKFTITDTSLEVGDVVEVNYIENLDIEEIYTFKVAGSGAQTATRRLIADVLVTNRTDGTMSMMRLEAPSIKFENSLSFTFDASNPSKFEVNLKIMGDATLTDEDGNPLFVSMSKLVTP
jgi:hypothetical protein